MYCNLDWTLGFVLSTTTDFLAPRASFTALTHLDSVPSKSLFTCTYPWGSKKRLKKVLLPEAGMPIKTTTSWNSWTSVNKHPTSGMWKNKIYLMTFLKRINIFTLFLPKMNILNILSYIVHFRLLGLHLHPSIILPNFEGNTSFLFKTKIFSYFHTSQLNINKCEQIVNMIIQVGTSADDKFRRISRRNFLIVNFLTFHKNKPGMAQVGAISKAQKQQKDFKVSKYSLLRYRKNPKVEPNWRTRGDTLRFFIHSVANH